MKSQIKRLKCNTIQMENGEAQTFLLELFFSLTVTLYLHAFIPCGFIDPTISYRYRVKIVDFRSSRFSRKCKLYYCCYVYNNFVIKILKLTETTRDLVYTSLRWIAEFQYIRKFGTTMYINILTLAQFLSVYVYMNYCNALADVSQKNHITYYTKILFSAICIIYNTVHCTCHIIPATAYNTMSTNVCKILFRYPCASFPVTLTFATPLTVPPSHINIYTHAYTLRCAFIVIALVLGLIYLLGKHDGL